MSSSLPMTFDGTPTLTPYKLSVLKVWYGLALGDINKASDDLDLIKYQTIASTLEDTLRLVYDIPLEETVDKVTKSTKGSIFKRSLVVLGVGVSLVLITGLVVNLIDTPVENYPRDNDNKNDNRKA